MHTPSSKKRVGVLVSGKGSNLQALIDACTDPLFPVSIGCVISNVASAYALERAQRAHIPSYTISQKEFSSRDAWESAITDTLHRHQTHIVCLAGFMRILSEGFIRSWPDCILNIHPSLLPAFKGLRTHERALQAGVRIHGCTVHMVRPQLDEGPILGQAAVPVWNRDTPESLACRVLDQEHRLYPDILRLFAQGCFHLEGERAVLDPAGIGSENGPQNSSRLVTCIPSESTDTQEGLCRIRSA